MVFHFAGKYNGDETSLPQREHPKGYVPFREPQSMKKLAVILNIAAIAVYIILVIVQALFAVCSINMIGLLLALLCLVPHEFLHAIWFQGDVFMYQNLRQGMLFVVGTEDISKARFIAMSLCPNIIFGLIPYVSFMANPNLDILGTLGALSLSMGVGDYMNVIHAVRQMPKGAVTYLSGIHSYWYIPSLGE